MKEGDTRELAALELSPWFFWALGLFFYLSPGEQSLAWLLPACLLHECGHLAAMETLGQSAARIRLGAFGFCITPTSVRPLSLWAQRRILLAGPAASIGFAAVLAAFAQREGAAVSFVLGALNLLPAPGLDGGELLRIALESRLSPACARCSVKLAQGACTAALALAGLWLFCKTGSPALLAFAGFLLLGGLKN